MKDSGVEWIGEIPENWELAKIGQHFKQRNEKVSDLDFKPLSVTKNGIVPQLDNAAKSSNHNDRKLVKKGDFVINSRSDRKQSSGIAYEDGSVSLINLVIRSRTVDTDFTNYLLKNAGFAEEFYRWGNGIVADLWSTKWDSMKRIPFPLPGLAEQKKIANVIQNKVKIIDSVIAETQQSINELKKYKQALITETVTKGLDKNVEMKDSGTPLLGKIPSNWESEKLKYCVKINDSKQTFSEGMKYIGLEHVNSGMGNINGYSTVASNSLEKAFKKGDILYSKLRPYLAKAFIASFDGVSSGEFLVLQDFRGNKAFLKYWLISNTFTDFVNASTYGTKMPRSSWETIKEMQMPLPSQQEQDEIVKYLDIKLREVSSLISNKVELISKLRDYKSSLIYEYVTGKKEA